MYSPTPIHPTGSGDAGLVRHAVLLCEAHDFFYDDTRPSWVGAASWTRCSSAAPGWPEPAASPAQRRPTPTSSRDRAPTSPGPSVFPAVSCLKVTASQAPAELLIGHRSMAG